MKDLEIILEHSRGPNVITGSLQREAEDGLERGDCTETKALLGEHLDEGVPTSKQPLETGSEKHIISLELPEQLALPTPGFQPCKAHFRF